MYEWKDLSVRGLRIMLQLARYTQVSPIVLHLTFINIQCIYDRHQRSQLHERTRNTNLGM